MARRKADPVFGARIERVLRPRFGLGLRKPLDREDILERIRRGAVIKASPPEPGMPCKERLNKERHYDPAFNAAVKEAIVEARRRKRNKGALAKLGADASWHAAERVVPHSIESDLRADIVGELNLLICGGEVSLDDDLTAAWKRCRAKLSGHRWKETSLDAPLAGTDRLSRLDLLDSEVERF